MIQMPFLTRLAPGARNASTNAGATVRAALPSRFAPGETPEPLTEQTSAIPAADTKTMLAAEASSPARGAKRAASEVNVIPTQAVSRPVMMPAAARLDHPALRSPLNETPEVKTSPMLRSSAADLPAPQAAPLSGIEKPVFAAIPREPMKPARAESEPVLKTASEPFASLSRPAADVRPPLRESAVAQRVASQYSEAPTVVQVTIDRVDVRMPPAAQPGQQLNSKPRTASTVSLGDYLRQRERARHGGSI